VNGADLDAAARARAGDRGDPLTAIFVNLLIEAVGEQLEHAKRGDLPLERQLALETRPLGALPVLAARQNKGVVHADVELSAGKIRRPINETGAERVREHAEADVPGRRVQALADAVDVAREAETVLVPVQVGNFRRAAREQAPVTAAEDAAVGSRDFEVTLPPVRIDGRYLRRAEDVIWVVTAL
jgi:hypothetical protein